MKTNGIVNVSVDISANFDLASSIAESLSHNELIDFIELILDIESCGELERDLYRLIKSRDEDNLIP